MLKYRDCIDHLGNPVARPLDKDGIAIVIGCILAVIIVWRWLA
jgi:hypothetical protein